MELIKLLDEPKELKNFVDIIQGIYDRSTFTYEKGIIEDEESEDYGKEYHIVSVGAEKYPKFRVISDPDL